MQRKLDLSIDLSLDWLVSCQLSPKMVVNQDNHSQREWNGLPILLVGGVFQSKSPSLTAANSSAVRLDGF